VIDDAEDLRRALEHPRLRRQDRQEGIGATVEIGREAGGLGLIGGEDVKLGGEALVQPAGEGGAERPHHRGDADIRGQREEECHERQGQRGKLLPRVGQHPFGEGTGDHRAQGRQPKAEEQRQRQRRAQQHTGQQREARDKAGAEPPDQPAQKEQAQRRNRLQPHRASRSLRPCAGLRRGQKRHACGADHRRRRGRARPEEGDPEARDGPERIEGQRSRNRCAVKAPQRPATPGISAAAMR
jgi:hypothetical protein